MKSIAITSDDKYIFTGDSKYGHIKQFSVIDGLMIKDYGQMFEHNFMLEHGVLSMTTTADNEWLFVTSMRGHLKQISLASQEVVHDYGKIQYDVIKCLESTRDSKWLITASYGVGEANKILIEHRIDDKDFSESPFPGIGAMKITPDGKKLLLGNLYGFLQLISLTDGKLLKDFGRVYDDAITGIVITLDHKFFFTSSTAGILKQWNYEDNTLVGDHGRIVDDIVSLCS
jgi:hypothetical protein